MLLQRGQQLLFDVTIEQVILVLTGNESRKIVRFRGLPCRFYVCYGEIGTAYVADFALLHQIVESAQRFLYRCQWIG